MMTTVMKLTKTMSSTTSSMTFFMRTMTMFTIQILKADDGGVEVILMFVLM